MNDQLVNNQHFSRKSFFWQPEYLDVSAWIEHIPFAFWITEVLNPKSVVELGVHNGVSYFSFCQAVRALNIDTVCYGVDTWQGDEHAGYYDDSIFNKVSLQNATAYSRFSTLIRSTFDQAKEYFPDNTIDLLHIDGLHTYEAVKHDFDTWFPKLTEDAYVVFHDINVRERGFGVFRLWEELKLKYNHLQFDFGHGLGIIAVGKIHQQELKDLFNREKKDTQYSFFRNLFFERGSFFKVSFENSNLLSQQVSENQSLKVAHTGLEENYKTLEVHYHQAIADREHLREEIRKHSEIFSSLESAHNELITEQEKTKSEYIQASAINKNLEQSRLQLEETVKKIEEENRLIAEKYNSTTLLHSQLQDEHDLLLAKTGLLNEKIKESAINNSQLKEVVVKLKNASGTIARLAEEQDRLSQQLSDYRLQKEKAHTSNKELEYIIDHQKKAIAWFKSTYVDRSLPGIIRQKIKDIFFKKKGTSAGPQSSSDVAGISAGVNISQTDKSTTTVNFHLEPAHNIIGEGPGRYSCIGTDPYFYVNLINKRLHKGWYSFSVKIKANKGFLVLPKLYYDRGRGFNEADVWNLPEVENDKIACFVNFPEEVTGLRFDPSSVSCSIEASQFKMRRLNKLQVLSVAISAYNKKDGAGKSYLTAWKDFLFTFFKHGKTGLREKVWSAVIHKHSNSDEDYSNWCKLYDTITAEQFEEIKSLSDKLSYKPLFSIVMPVYNAPLNFLIKAVESVKAQAYADWELCIADDHSNNDEVKKVLSAFMTNDSRIKVVFRDTNGHISKASNSALELATGDYIILLDQDDEIRPHALYLVAKAINENKELGLIYSDEDKIDEEGRRFDPYFKTAWNKDLFYGQNMINHLGIYKHSLVKKIGGFRVGFEGSQDYDLVLRCVEHLREDQIFHIPHVLYHWRAIKGSTAVTVSNKNYAVDAGIKALNEHFYRTQTSATAEKNINNSYRVKWALPDKLPLVSIIIPTKDKVNILKTCVDSVLQKTSYSNYELLIMDNNSTETETLSYLHDIQRNNPVVRVCSYDSPFNFSAINNYGVSLANGDIILLLNNDTEVLNKDWLNEIVSHCIRPEIGVVGVKLYYPNGLIQHAGVFLSEGHPGIHIYLKREKNDAGYMNKLNLVQNYSAVTAACFAVRKEVYLEVGGLDEQNLKVAYNDVDFCLKVKAAGYKNLWTPFAELVHYESLSRGDDMAESNLPRFRQEQTYMLKTWKKEIENDPFFNGNLNTDTQTTRCAFPPRIPYEWQEKF